MTEWIFPKYNKEVLIELITALYEFKGTNKRKKEHIFGKIINFIIGQKAEADNIRFYYEQEYEVDRLTKRPSWAFEL